MFEARGLLPSHGTRRSGIVPRVDTSEYTLLVVSAVCSDELGDGGRFRCTFGSRFDDRCSGVGEGARCADCRGSSSSGLVIHDHLQFFKTLCEQLRRLQARECTWSVTCREVVGVTGPRRSLSADCPHGSIPSSTR